MRDEVDVEEKEAGKNILIKRRQGRGRKLEEEGVKVTKGGEKE